MKDMHCLGSYGPMIADACRSGDNIRMMQIMQAAGTCLNILESITVKHWADDVFKKSAPKCIVWEGKDYTPVEFMKAYAAAHGEETAEAEPTFQF